MQWLEDLDLYGQILVFIQMTSAQLWFNVWLKVAAMFLIYIPKNLLVASLCYGPNYYFCRLEGMT